MADVIQFWEMQMSTHRTGKYKHDLWNGRDYSKYNREKNLTMNANMKVSEQCIAASKGNQVLGMIRRNISYKVWLYLCIKQ